MSASKLQEEAAALLSNLKNCFRSSETSLKFLVSSINKMTDIYLDIIKEMLVEKLQPYDGYLKVNDVVDVLQLFRGHSLFSGVSSTPQAEKFIENLTAESPVTLQKVVLKKKLVIRDGVPVWKDHHFGYVTPFLAQLQQLLNNPDVLSMVNNPLKRIPGKLRTVLDGIFFRYNTVACKHGDKTLGFGVSYDDVEPTDSCKSKTKTHNMRLYYWILFNIYPEGRSSLKSINLLAIVKKSVAKEYGNAPFLKLFLDGIKRLASEEGVTMTIGKMLIVFHGCLVLIMADHPALSNLGGFKETHFALRPCNTCMITNACLCDSFKDDLKQLRNLQDHEAMIYVIEETEAGTSDKEIKKACKNNAVVLYRDHEDPSIAFGINKRSVLMDSPGFDVCRCLPHDVMHTLPEGCIELVCRLLLRDACLPKKVGEKTVVALKLDTVNDFIKELCNLGHWNQYKPSKIEKDSLSSKLKQSAAQLICLAHILPFILNSLIDPKKLELLLKILKILDICMLFELTDTDLNDLEKLVDEFGTSLKELFPEIRTLKLHFLVHLKLYGKLFGPFRQSWCFRVEAMHRQFTRYVDGLQNMINLPYSTGSRHLAKRNAEFLEGKKSGNYLGVETTISSQDSSIRSLPATSRDKLFSMFPHLNLDKTVAVAKNIKKKGCVYKKGVIVLLEDKSETKEAVFGKIDQMFIVDEEIVFAVHILKTKHQEHYNAFEIESYFNGLKLVSLKNLVEPYPLVRMSLQFDRRTHSAFILNLGRHDI